MPQGWEWLLLLLVMLVTPVVLIVVLAKRSRRRREADDKARAAIDPGTTLNALFSGEPTVTYHVGPTSLTFETVVSGAIERGYRLAGQNGGTLVFAKAV